MDCRNNEMPRPYRHGAVDEIHKMMLKIRHWAAAFMGFYLGAICGHFCLLNGERYMATSHNDSTPYNAGQAFIMLVVMCGLIWAILLGPLRGVVCKGRPDPDNPKTCRIWFGVTAISYILAVISNPHPFIF